MVVDVKHSFSKFLLIRQALSQLLWAGLGWDNHNFRCVLMLLPLLPPLLDSMSSSLPWILNPCSCLPCKECISRRVCLCSNAHHAQRLILTNGGTLLISESTASVSRGWPRRVAEAKLRGVAPDQQGLSQNGYGIDHG